MTDPDADGTRHSTDGVNGAPEGTATAAASDPGTPASGLAERVAEQVAERPEAGRPGSAEPGEPAGTGVEQVVDGATAAGLAEAGPATARPAPHPAATPRPTPRSAAAQENAPGAGTAPTGVTPVDGPEEVDTTGEVDGTGADPSRAGGAAAGVTTAVGADTATAGAPDSAAGADPDPIPGTEPSADAGGTEPAPATGPGTATASATAPEPAADGAPGTTPTDDEANPASTAGPAGGSTTQVSVPPERPDPAGPAAGSPAAATSAATTPAAATSGPDTPAAANPATATPSTGTPATGTPGTATTTAATPGTGTPGTGTPGTEDSATDPNPVSPNPVSPNPVSPNAPGVGGTATAAEVLGTGTTPRAAREPGPTSLFERPSAPTATEPVADEQPATASATAGATPDTAPRPGSTTGAQDSTALLPVTPPLRDDVPDSEATTRFIQVHDGPGDQPTDVFPTSAGGPAPPSGPHVPGGTDRDDTRPPRSRRLLVLAGVLVVLLLLYVGDIVFSLGSVPRGVTVAGVSVGGLSEAAAEQRLREQLEPRSAQPVAVTAGEVSTEIDPAEAGLAVNWPGTLEQAGSQPLNPITRLTSFFTEREIGVVTVADPTAVAATLEQLGPVVDRAPVEGGVTFSGAEPVPVDPVPGQRLDLSAATEVLVRDWASGAPVVLPLVVLPPTTTAADVTAAIEDVARPAVSAPVEITGEGGTSSELTPEEIATALTFRPDPEQGGLVAEINQEAVVEAVSEDLAPSERPGRDARLDFSSGTPVVVPSEDGRGVDYDVTLADLLGVLTGSGPREITAVYADQPAELTTAEIEELGINGVIGEFTTGGFAADSGQNIRRAAEQINGMVVEPGETFSLNGATAPRNAANGYVEAGIIEDGRPDRGIGGGVSQIATTLYNASYFAGMTDVEHRAHSFYISRYPPGREATVFEGAIDLRFRNDNPTGVLIETVWSPSSLTIRLYGTKRYDVTSAAGPRTNPTQPNTVNIPPGEPCNPSGGAPGFTITDTRTLRDVNTGETRSETQTTRYNPSPTVVCGN